MVSRVVFPGTFDPITNGHKDLIERAARLFSEVIVAIAGNNDKSPALPLATRVDLAKSVLASSKNVRVCGFDNLLVDFMKKEGISIVVRGLRAVSDFEYEFQLATMNRRMNSQLETVFLTPAENHAFLSSSLVREIARLGGDVSLFVDPVVAAALQSIHQL